MTHRQIVTGKSHWIWEIVFLHDVVSQDLILCITLYGL